MMLERRNITFEYVEIIPQNHMEETEIPYLSVDGKVVKAKDALLCIRSMKEGKK